MATWMVQYWGDHGTCSKLVDADSRQSALALAEVPLSRVVKVARDRVFPTADFGFATSLKPSRRIQVLFLARALALFASGGANLVNQLITSLPEVSRIAGKRPQSLRDDLELSAKLRHLTFSPAVVAIIESGEKTGRLTDALQVSLLYLKQMLEISGKHSRQLAFGVLLIVASLTMFFSLPLLLTEPIDMLRKLRGVEVNFTLATHVLLLVNALVRDYGWLLALSFGGGVAAVWHFRHVLMEAGPFRVFGSLQKTRRSIHFLVVWRAFRSAGLPLEEQTGTLSSALGARACAHILKRLQRGESLTETLSQRFFSPTLVLAVAGLSQVDIKIFSGIVDMLLTSLREEQQAGASRAAAAMYATGAILTIAMVLLLAFGLIFPIMGASAGAF